MRRLRSWVISLYARHLREQAQRHEEIAVLALEDAADCDTRADRLARGAGRTRPRRGGDRVTKILGVLATVAVLGIGILNIIPPVDLFWWLRR
jgi:hypothetical protein